MKKIMYLICLFTAFFLLAGCLPQKSKKKVVIHTLQINTTPADAVAHVAGKTFKLPYKFKMTPGRYLFRIEKDGYAPEWFSCRVSNAGIEVPVTAADGSLQWQKKNTGTQEINLRQQGGTVLLTSTPDMAQISKDGKAIGVTPQVLTNLAVGKHEVTLQSPNYADVTVSWEIRNNRPILKQTDLQSNIGEVDISSTPSQARLFIGGKFISTTPHRGTFPVGKHAIQLQKDGYILYEGHIDVQHGKPARKDIQLTLSPSTLSITSVPTGSQVFIDGKLQGTTPLELKDIASGQYKITVSHDSYDQLTEKVELAPGSTLRKEFVLASSEGGIELNIYPAGVKVFLNGRDIGTVQPGDSATQTRVIRVGKLSPGIYTVKAVHQRANTEIRKIHVYKGQIARPPRIELWVPNAEIVWKDNGKTEVGMIYGTSEKVILFGPQKGIRYEINKKDLKSFKFLNINE